MRLIIYYKGGIYLVYQRRRYKSHSLLSHEALFRRLKLGYRKNDKIVSEYLKERAGFYGEKNMDYQLALFPNQDFLHFPDLRLHNFSNYFQIDSLIMTPKVFFILEAKHLKGIIEYNASSRQLIQMTDNLTTSYKDPILQAETQKKHLSHWLKQHHIDIPIEPLVVSTNHSTIIRNQENDDLFKHRFVPLENLLYKIDEIYKTYSKKILNTKELESMFNVLSQAHEPGMIDLIKYYKIQDKHLLQGIFCEECQKGYVTKRRYDWICSHCYHTMDNGHTRILLDYFLLEEKFINNKVARNVLGIDSRDVVYRLLDSLKLKKTGVRKGRKYHAPFIWQFPQDAEPAFLQRSVFDY